MNPKTKPKFTVRGRYDSKIEFSLALLSVLASMQTQAQVALPASAKVTADTTKPGFLWRVFQNNADQVNSTAKTEAALGGTLSKDGSLLPNQADPSAQGPAAGPGTKLGTADNALIEFVIPEVINFSQAEGESNGNFTPDLQMPGVPGTEGGADGIAAEIITYLDLPAGVITMGVNSDDGFRTQAGTLGDAFRAVNLGEFSGGRGASDTTFTFAVTEAGVYPFRTTWEEGGGGANVEWFTVKADGTKVLVNDAANGGVKAYRAANVGPKPPTVVSVVPGPAPRQLNGVSPNVVVVLADGETTTITDSSISFKVDGIAVTDIKRSGKQITLTYTPTGIQFPDESHTAELSFAGSGGFTRTEKWTFKNLKNVILPATAVATENFDSTAEGTQPAGWVATNFTPECNAGEDPTDQKSDTYRNWVTVTTENMPLIDDAGITEVNATETINGKPLTLELLRSGKVLYAESDSRCNGTARAEVLANKDGQFGQTQFIVSKAFNLTTAKNPVLAFSSGYMQNQDSYGGVEYSVDGGKSWLPVVYFLDGPVIKTAADGSIDGVATLNTVRGDTSLWVVNGEVKGERYGDAVAAPINASIGNYIVERVNDNGAEGKRTEIFRLPAAANQADVRLRLSATGSDSWYFFVDNIAFYDIAPPAPSKTKPDAPQIAVSAPLSVFASTVTLNGSAFSGVNASDVNAKTVLQVSTFPGLVPATGFTNVLASVTDTNGATSLSFPASRLFPGKTYYVSAQYQDRAGVKSDFSAPISVTVPAAGEPVYLETFEAAPDFGLPEGWTANNQTDTATAGSNPADPKSDVYKDWVVVPDSALDAFGGARNDANVVNGKSLYAESDNRGGNQIQKLRSPNYDLRGRQNVWLVFKSNYVQNQDSIGVLEYTVDNGANWLPLTYMIDDKATGGDIIRTNGVIDVVTTLTKTAGDIAKIIDPATNARVAAGKYADFILAKPIESLAPYLSGRIDDDKVESRRLERFRLTAADNAAAVAFRFVQAGTGSWWWGIDDLAIYALDNGAAPRLSVAKQGTNLSISWTGAGTLQSADTVKGPWTDIAGATTSPQVVAPSAAGKFYRLRL